MPNLKKDYKQFASNNKFQWYMTIVIIMFILRSLGYMPVESFVEIIKWATMGLFGSEGLDQITNKREL